MAKHSDGFNKNVLEYFQGGRGYDGLVETYQISFIGNIKKMKDISSGNGEDNIRPSRQPTKYSFKSDLYAVELYLSTETSYKNFVFAFSIRSCPYL